MIRKAILAGSLAIASYAHAQTDAEIKARLTPTVHQCESAPENGGTVQQAICYGDEAIRQDLRLNETWTRVIKKLKQPAAKNLRRHERLWIVSRDKECREEQSNYVNSTAAYMFNLCMVDAAISRIIRLEHIR